MRPVPAAQRTTPARGTSCASRPVMFRARGGFRALDPSPLARMQTLGHDWLDVLKMDIEGSEYATLGHLATLSGDTMRFTQLQLEVHHGWSPAHPGMPNVAQFDLLRDLLDHSYRMTLLEPNIYFAAQTCHELVMLKVDACGNVVTPPPGAAAAAKDAPAAPEATVPDDLGATAGVAGDDLASAAAAAENATVAAAAAAVTPEAEALAAAVERDVLP